MLYKRNNKALPARRGSSRKSDSRQTIRDWCLGAVIFVFLGASLLWAAAGCPMRSAYMMLAIALTAVGATFLLVFSEGSLAVKPTTDR